MFWAYHVLCLYLFAFSGKDCTFLFQQKWLQPLLPSGPEQLQKGKCCPSTLSWAKHTSCQMGGSGEDAALFAWPDEPFPNPKTNITRGFPPSGDGEECVPAGLVFPESWEVLWGSAAQRESSGWFCSPFFPKLAAGCSFSALKFAGLTGSWMTQELVWFLVVSQEEIPLGKIISVELVPSFRSTLCRKKHQQFG